MTDSERKTLEETAALLDEIEAREAVAWRFSHDKYIDEEGKSWDVFCVTINPEAIKRNAIHAELAERDARILEQSRAEVFGVSNVN
jgi:hypothetical protein